jgi:serine protease Do
MFSIGRRSFSSLLLIVTGLIVGVVVSSQIDYTAHSDAQSIQISEESADFLTRTGKAMAEITSAVKPAIVNISTSQTVKMGSGDPFFNDPFFRRFFGDRFGPQHPRERKSTGMGILLPIITS